MATEDKPETDKVVGGFSTVERVKIDPSCHGFTEFLNEVLMLSTL
jgi:hypothetical protein